MLYFLVNFVLLGTGLIYSAESIVEFQQDILKQKFIFQEMQKQDIDKITKLFRENPDIGDYTNMNSDFSYYCDNSGYKIYLCKDKTSSDVYGFLLAVNHGSSLYVRALGVDKNLRNYGIATKLLQSAYNFAENNNYDRLTIQASNQKAQNCYEKFGFKLDSTIGYLTIKFSIKKLEQF